jgi:hypothetical protein
MFAGVGGLAVVAGAFLAVALLNDPSDQAPVGQVSPSASIAVPAASATILPTLPPPSVAPSVAPSTEPVPSAAPLPTPVPSPEPAMFLAVTGPADNQLMTVRDGETGDTIVEAGAPPGEPIAADLSPDGAWLASIAVVGESGMTEVLVTRVTEGGDDVPLALGQTEVVGRGIAGSPFLEILSWSSDSRYLAYSLVDPDGGGVDAHLFDTSDASVHQVTDTGIAYAAGWVPAGEDEPRLLWVSSAGETPRSDLLIVDDELVESAPIDPADSDLAHAQNVFLPQLSPNGAFVIFWAGHMDRIGDEWLFSEGGAPWLAQNTADGEGGFEFTSARELFSDVSVGRDGFVSAAVTWGGDGDAYAVWEVAWAGLPQSEDGPYPDPARVYFGHATDPRGLTMFHAIDSGDLPPDAFVVDVKVAATGRHLVITAAQPRAGVFDPPSADLLLVERNTGDVADVVTHIGSADDGWFGPAAFDTTR